MTERGERIADLYYASGSIKTEGSFPISAHRDNPDLPPSPYYLHFPKPGEPGSKYLPEIFDLVGEEFYTICEAHQPAIRPRWIAGTPDGALGIGEAFVYQYVDYPNNVVTFTKQAEPTNFINPEVEPEEGWQEGDELVPVDDHKSGGRNGIIFVNAARQYGFRIEKTLAIVDRQQGATENHEAQGVKFLHIMTARQLLEHGVHNGYIKSAVLEKVEAYREANQFKFN